MLLPKKREFPRQTGREEKQILLPKIIRIGKHFLGFTHLENYKVNTDSLVEQS